MDDLKVLEQLDPVDGDAVERAASDPVFEEVLDEIMNDETAAAARDGTGSCPAPRRLHYRRRRNVLAVAAVVVLLGMLLVGLGVTGGEHPGTTGGGKAHQAGTWQLLDTALTGTWQQNLSGPPTGWLSCSSDACYVVAKNFSTSGVGAALQSVSFSVSSDAGITWTSLPMPGGFVPATTISCSGTTWCAVGGADDGQPVLVTTADGGHSFAIHPLPGGVGALASLSCPSVHVCAGLAASGMTPGGEPRDATFLQTADGGSTFTDVPIVAGDSMLALACDSALDCTAVGTTDATMARSSRVRVGVTAVTTDGGHAWNAGAFPTGFGVGGGFPPQLSCPDALHCFVTGLIAIPNPSQCGSGPPTSTVPVTPTPQVQAIAQSETAIAKAAVRAELADGRASACSSNSETTVSDIASSGDGGLTWTPEPLPTNVPLPRLDGLSCPTDTECWAAGSELVQQVMTKIVRGTTSSGSGALGAQPPTRAASTTESAKKIVTVDATSPVLVGTANGGATWSKVTFTVPRTAPNATGQSFLAIGRISCPNADACVATGSTAQGSPTAPVYSLVRPEHS